MMKITEANVADWRAWLRILDPNTGEIFFDCEHCGTGDYGWNWFAGSSVNSFHSRNDAELFNSASWVIRDHPYADVVGFMAEDFIEWWNKKSKD
jgi:hypothetical protein